MTNHNQIRYATELATTLRRGGFEAHTTSDLEKRKAALVTRKEAQQKRNDPQITHTIADLAAIQLVRCVLLCVARCTWPITTR